MSQSDFHRRRVHFNTNGIIFLTIFLDLVGFSIIFPLFPAMLDFFIQKENSSRGLFGFIIQSIQALVPIGQANPQFMITVLFGGILGSLYSFLQFIFSPIWGNLSDRFGRRTILAITLAGTMLSYIIWVFSSTFGQLVFSRVLGGIMAGNLSVATAVIADITPKENRTKGMALIGVAFGLGFLIGPAIGGYASLIDLRNILPNSVHSPFAMAAVAALALSIINLIWMLTQLPETLSAKNRQKDGRRKNIFAQIGQIEIASIKRTCIVYLLFLMAFSGMEFTLTFLTSERFLYTPKQNGHMFVFIGLSLLFIQGFFVRKFASIIGEKKLALWGIGSGMVAFALLAFTPNVTFFYIALSFLSIAVGFITPNLLSLVSLYSPESRQGFFLGAFRSCGSLARATGPLFAALLYFYFGSTIAYTLGAIVLLIPLILAWPLPQPAK